MTYREALLACMDGALRDYRDTIVLGQGVADHKGLFGSTLGLVDTYGPDRVMDMPIAEESMTGIAVGLALNGMYPILTHMRMDFVLAAMNQMVNLVAKYRYMFGGRFRIPMLIRMVVGRSWGQGAQHSQALTAMVSHIPGFTVLTPATASIVATEYPRILRERTGPVVSIEHRLLYDIEDTPLAHAGDDLTIVAISLMTVEAVRAARYAARHQVYCDVIDIPYPSHIDVNPILYSLERTGKLLILDIGWSPFGLSAEICRLVAERCPQLLCRPVVSLGTAFCPCPTSKPLEDLFYPDQSRIVGAIAKLADKEIPVPLPSSTVQDYRKFRGPF